MRFGKFGIVPKLKIWKMTFLYRRVQKVAENIRYANKETPLGLRCCASKAQSVKCIFPPSLFQTSEPTFSQKIHFLLRRINTAFSRFSSRLWSGKNISLLPPMWETGEQKKWNSRMIFLPQLVVGDGKNYVQ